MSRAKDKRGAGARQRPGAVTVCRGCCCGRPEKAPGVDHAAQLATIRAAVPAGQVRISECLDVCERSNVVVISPSSEGRAAGGRPVWLGLVNDVDVLADIAAWIDAGGPGSADMPPILELYEFSPSRRVRADSGLEAS